MARRLLWASLGLAPITIVVRFVFDVGDVAQFALAAISLVPLAWLIGEATEHAAKKTGPGIGGFLNATFGNAPELIIALFAVNDGLVEVVRGSLTGSVVGNLLLVLGVSLIVGPVKEIDRRSSLISVGLVLGATLLFTIVAATDWAGGRATTPSRCCRSRSRSSCSLSTSASRRGSSSATVCCIRPPRSTRPPGRCGRH